MNNMQRAARAQFSIQRSYRASVDEAWALWTTKAGIESWWGPEGFKVTVTSIDLRPGGNLIYAMTAVAPDQVAFMKQAGMPLTSECKVTYTEVAPPHRLAYKTLADFVPGIPPYEVVTIVDLKATDDGLTVTIKFDAMHDDIWTERARAGHESQLRKLDALLASSRSPNTVADRRSGVKYSVTIDVPSLDEGLRFYRDALGLVELARPIATYVILKCGGSQIGLMEKSAGTKPAKGSNDTRRYERHWTPVHIDFHVEDFEGVVAKVLDGGAKCEQKFEGGPRPPIAFCSDPFGNGFCIVGAKAGT